MIKARDIMDNWIIESYVIMFLFEIKIICTFLLIAILRNLIEV